jgi:hypothetical protein
MGNYPLPNYDELRISFAVLREYLRFRMQQNLIAIEIGLRKGRALDERQLQAVLASLASVYNEAVVWAAGEHVAAIVAGDRSLVLQNVFTHFAGDILHSQLYENDEAMDFFLSISNGKNWSDCSFAEKVSTVQSARANAEAMESIGAVLTGLFDLVMQRLRYTPMVSGNKNSWKYSAAVVKKGERKPRVNVFRDTFFRFSVN